MVGRTVAAVGGTLVGGTLVGGMLVGGMLVGGALVGGALVGGALVGGVAAGAPPPQATRNVAKIIRMMRPLNERTRVVIVVRFFPLFGMV